MLPGTARSNLSTHITAKVLRPKVGGGSRGRPPFAYLLPAYQLAAEGVTGLRRKVLEGVDRCSNLVFRNVPEKQIEGAGHGGNAGTQEDTRANGSTLIS